MPKKPPAVTCAENIALLNALHTVPRQPSKTERPPSASAKWPGNYRLSFNEERLIASFFAFLSSISDNSNNVTAVCVQEIHDGGQQESLRLLLAMNRLDHGSRPTDPGVVNIQTVLETIKTGLMSVMEPLKRLDKDHGSAERKKAPLQTIEEAVFTAIVSMCEKRIQCRLRLIETARGISKPQLKETLQRAIESLRRPRNNANSISDKILDPMIDSMKSIIRLLDAWKKHQVFARLLELVEGVHRLNETPELHNAIRSIPNTNMDPGSRESLVNTIRKVARYRQIARLLYRLAKDTTPTLRRTSVVIVDLPPAAYERVQPSNDYTPNIVAKINEVSNPVAYSKDRLDVLFRYLGTDRGAASRTFGEQTRKTLAEAKIHAEIQLAAYCSSSTIHQLPPRVVRSNKDACFLCGVFLQNHSNMYTSRHHGKLYPGWRLPQTLSVSVKKSFNEELASIIRSSINTLYERETKTRYLDPTESTLTSIPSLRSRVSLLSTPPQPQSECLRDESAVSEVANKDDPVEDKMDAATPNVIVEDTASIDASPPNNSHPPDDLLPESEDPQTESSTSVTSDESPTEPISTEPGLHFEAVPNASPVTSIVSEKTKPVRGLPSLSLSGRVQHGQTSSVLNFPPFEIQFDYARNDSSADDKITHLNFTLHQVPLDDIGRLQTENVAVVDVEKQCFGEDVLCTLDHLDTLYIAGQGSFLKISLGFPTAR